MNKLKLLNDVCAAGVILSINEHKTVYESVEQYLRSELIDSTIFAEMIIRDTIVIIHFYPDTPVGFHVVYHYDIDLALDECLKLVKL